MTANDQNNTAAVEPHVATIYIGVFISLISAGLCAGSVHIAMFIVFRFTTGFGGFMISMAVPLWITEVVPPEVRGAFAQCHGACLSLGHLLASYVGVGFFTNKSIKGLNAWRGPVAIVALPALILFCGLWWVPESSRYLLMKSRNSQARQIVRRFHAAPGDPEHVFAEMEIFQMERQIELDRTLPSSWLCTFKTPSTRKRMAMGVFLVFAILSTGNLCIATFSNQIMAHSGWPSLAQLSIQTGMFAAVMPGITGAVFFTEKFRRPTLVVIGLTGMCILISCYMGVATSFNLAEPGHRGPQIACVVLLYLFQIFSASFTEGPLSYWAAEFYPTHLRANGQTVQVVAYGAVGLLWTQTAPIGLANLGWKFFLVFLSITLCSTIIIYWYFPGTQGKTLEEVALLFGDDDIVVVHQQDIQMDNNQITGILYHGKEAQTIVQNIEDISHGREEV